MRRTLRSLPLVGAVRRVPSSVHALWVEMSHPTLRGPMLDLPPTRASALRPRRRGPSTSWQAGSLAVLVTALGVGAIAVLLFDGWGLDRSERARYSATVAAALTVALATYVAWRQRQEAQTSIRMKEATGLLRREDQLDRASGVKALGRLASDVPGIQPDVVETLCEFIRQRGVVSAARPALKPVPPRGGHWPRHLPPPLPGPTRYPLEVDVEAAVREIARRRLGADGGVLLDLRNAYLPEARLAGLWAPRARFGSAILDEAVLDGAVLTDADLSQATLDRASLNGARLQGARLARVVAHGANMRGVDLSRIQAPWIDLGGADLREATLDHANLRGANLSSAKLIDCRLVGVKFGEGANLEHARAPGATFERASFSRWTSLKRGNFRGASFRGATLGWADLDGADLRGADLIDANFEGPGSVARAKLDGAVASSSTVWGYGFGRAEAAAAGVRFID